MPGNLIEDGTLIGRDIINAGMAARVGSLGERRNPRAEAAAHRLDEVGVVGLAEMVGGGVVELAST
jgi:hypothetical protein